MKCIYSEGCRAAMVVLFRSTERCVRWILPCVQMLGQSNLFSCKKEMRHFGFWLHFSMVSGCYGAFEMDAEGASITKHMDPLLGSSIQAWISFLVELACWCHWWSKSSLGKVDLGQSGSFKTPGNSLQHQIECEDHFEGAYKPDKKLSSRLVVVLS